MTIAGQSTNFFSGNVQIADALRIIYKSGTKVLWADKNHFDLATKKEAWKGGKEVRMHFSLSAGGGSMGGMASERGTFARTDRARGIQGSYHAKFQTFTLGHDRMSEEMSKGDAASFISEKKREYQQKIKLHRTELAVQRLGDGTGRKCTPIGIGALNADAGASFAHTENMPLPVKIGNGLNVAGSIAHLYEDAVVSFIFASYDEDDNGVYELNETNCIPRYLNVSFLNGGTRATYEAFRVVRYDQDTQIAWVMPGRKQVDGTTGVEDYIQQSYWVKDDSAAMTVTFRRGRTFDGLGASVAVDMPDISGALNPAGRTPACFWIHPEFITTGNVSFGGSDSNFTNYSTTTMTSAAIGRLQLGLGWTSDTQIDKISPFVVTGFETLMKNMTNTIHGIKRSKIIQMLPTAGDGLGRPLDLSMLNRWITTHVLRNEGKLPEWSTIIMNSLVYSYFEVAFMKDMKVEQTEQGGFAAHYIIVSGKKFKLTGHPGVRHDTIFAIPDKVVTLYGMEVTPVNVGGTSTFIALDSAGRRVNAEEQYFTTYGEQVIEDLKACAFLTNFTIA